MCGKTLASGVRVKFWSRGETQKSVLFSVRPQRTKMLRNRVPKELLDIVVVNIYISSPNTMASISLS